MCVCVFTCVYKNKYIYFHHLNEFQPYNTDLTIVITVKMKLGLELL